MVRMAQRAVAQRSIAMRDSSLTQNKASPPEPLAFATNLPLHVLSPMLSCFSFMMP